MIYIGITIALVIIGLTMSHYDLKTQRKKRRVTLQTHKRYSKRKYP